MPAVKQNTVAAGVHGRGGGAQKAGRGRRVQQETGVRLSQEDTLSLLYFLHRDPASYFCLLPNCPHISFIRGFNHSNPPGAVLEVKSQPHLLGVPLFSKGFFGKWAGRSLLSRGAKSSPSLCHLDAGDKLTTGKHCGLQRDHRLTRPAPRLPKETFKDRCHAS